MSSKYPGGFITKSPVAPTSSAASGVWTLDQQQQYQKAGTWPAPPIFIEDLFSTYLYNGTGAAQTITNGIDLSTNGGLVWMKSRTSNPSYEFNVLVDTARAGILISNATDAASGSGQTTYNTNGFTINAGYTAWNSSGQNYASWTFRKQPKFFDVVTYTGNGSTQTINHNLGSAPGCIIIKVTNQPGSNWWVWHRGDGTTFRVLNLDNTSVSYTSSYSDGNSVLSAAPTSTSFSVKNTSADAYGTNQTGGTYVAYLFAHDAGGFPASGGGSTNGISCGSFTTDASGNATVNLGYEPQWLLIKSSSNADNWKIGDNMRGWTTSEFRTLLPNLTNAEGSSSNPVITSTGFQMVADNANRTFIYIAIRRGPMKTPTTGTSVLALSTWTGSSGNKDLGSQTANFGTGYLSILKSRTAAQVSGVFDAIRGKAQYLITSTVDSEAVDGANAGISVVNNQLQLNSSSYFGAGGDGTGQNYIGWNFRRAPSFFDEVCYTGDSATPRTITHNLGVAPELMLIKSRSNGRGWAVYSSAIGANKYLILNGTNASLTDTTIWVNTAPTSSVFTVGNPFDVNNSGYTYVAYLFATCAGVSKVGSYTGTGATQTIDCGFTGGARFVLIKRTDSTGSWYVWDTARGMVAGTDPLLMLNSSDVEVNANLVYTVTTGFQLVTGATDLNASGGTYIFLAIA